MDRGFTIIETTLFVAISGLLAVMVLVGFSSSIEANRRIDTNRSFEAAIEAEYTSVRTGTVIREVGSDGKVPACKTTGPPPLNGPTSPTYPGASDDCIIIGKLLKITPGVNSSVTTYNVVADVVPGSTCDLTLTGIRAIIDRFCYGAQVIDMGNPTGVIIPEWQAQISAVDFQSKTNSSTFRSRNSSQVSYIAILRAPGSELVYIALLDRTNDINANRFVLGQPPDNQISNYENAKGQICIQHQGLLSDRGYLRFNGGSSLGSVDILPDPLFSGVTC